MESSITSYETLASALAAAEAKALAHEARAKAAEAQLAAIQEIIDVSAYGVFHWRDTDDGEVEVSETFWRLLGREPHPNPVRPDFLRPLVHPSDKEYVKAEWLGAAAQLGTARYPVRLLNGDEEWRWFEIRVKAHRDSEDGPTRLTCVMVDIHDRHTLEQALIRSDEKLNIVIEASKAGAWDLADVEDNYMELSPTFRRVLGFAPDAIIPNNTEFFSERIHPDDTHLNDEAFARALADPEGHYEARVRFRFADDTYRHIRSMARLGPGARPGSMRLTGACFDIHDEVVAKQRLERTLDTLAIVIDAVRAGIYDVPDTRTSRVEMDDSLLALLGYTHHDRDELQADFSALVHPDDLPALYDYHYNILSTQGDRYNWEFRLRTKAGPYRWIRSHGRVMLVEAPDHFRITGAMFDINDMHEAQEQLREAHDNLEQFAYVVAHDLSAPLRYIDAFAEALAEDIGDGLTEEPADHIARIRMMAQRSQAMIRGLLEFSRLGQSTLIKTAVDVTHLIGELTEVVDPERQVHWRISPLPRVHADPVQLTILFQNLLANAAKFSLARGAGAEVEILATEDTGREVEILVRDNGVGFRSELSAEIFEVFRRAQEHKHIEGTGIGLANVARIASRHGGSVRAESSTGAGATFFVRLPR